MIFFIIDNDFYMAPPCQPIGCDAGYHLPGCVYAVVDSEEIQPEEKTNGKRLDGSKERD